MISYSSLEIYDIFKLLIYDNNIIVGYFKTKLYHKV